MVYQIIYMKIKNIILNINVIQKGSSGSPILNINNNKIIGIHKEGTKQYNKGTFLNYPIKEFIKLNTNNNEILLKEFNNKYHTDIKDTKINKL